MQQHQGLPMPFPEAVYAFATDSHLGLPTVEYRWGFSCLEALLMPLLGFWPIFTVIILPNMFSNGLANALAGLPGLLVILVIDIACIWYFVECFRRRSSWRVYVFTDGFAYFKGSRREVFRWEEIDDITEHVTSNQYGRPLFYYYRVTRTDGYRVTLNYHLAGIRAVRELGRTIMQRIDSYRFLEELKKYRAGEVLDFGSIKISQQGVNFHNRLLPWEQVKEIVLDVETKSKTLATSIIIRGKEESETSGALISAASVRSVSLFMALIRTILK